MSVLAVVLLVAACAGERPQGPVPAGRGELLASGELWGEQWKVFCGVDTSAAPSPDVGAAPAGACESGAHPHPCVHVEYLSSLISCQLEQLPERLLFSHSLPGPDDDRLLFFGVVHSSVARIELSFEEGANKSVDLIEIAGSDFNLFVTGLTAEEGSTLRRPVLWDAEGRIMNPEA
ncbi:MAG TPA: hypothetical protein VGB83_06735 [Actinomycetota bacterium]